jgi:PAS domain S-box-containing protein
MRQCTSFRRARLQRGEAPNIYEVRAHRSDGSTIWLETFPSVIDWEGKEAIQATYVDITERKRANEALAKSEAMFRGLLDDATMGIFIRQGDKAVYANQAFASLYGYECPEQILALKSVDGIEAPAERSRFEKYRARRMKGLAVPAVYEFQGLRKDGTLIWLENHVQLTFWNEEPALLVIVTDVSDRRHAQIALQELNRELEQRIEDRTREVAEKSLVIEAAFESISEGFALFDTDDRLLFWNDAYEQLCAPVQHVFEPGVPYETLLRAFVEDGHVRHPSEDHESAIQARLARHRDPGGKFEVQLTKGQWTLLSERRTSDGGIALVHTDITEMKRVERDLRLAQARLVDAIESLPMSFIIYDAEDRVMLANNITEELFPPLKGFIKPGTPARDLIRRNLDAHWFPDAIGDEEEWMETRIANFRDNTRESEFRTADGRTLRAIERPISDGGTVAIRLDITEQKDGEQALLEAKQQADAANRSKSEFLSSMSHELRTPLNAILGFTQLLRDYSDQPLTDEQRTSVEQILDGGKHLLGLISEVLDLSRIESGRLALSVGSVNLAQAVRGSLELVQPLADKREISLIMGADIASVAPVKADLSRLKQVLLNLLSNAVKYNREKGTVTVGAATTGSGMIRISITDTGHGIPDAKHDEVFRPFSRLGAEASKIEGTGIGLTISRQLVENMGGRLDFESNVGEGSTFWFELPTADPETRSPGDA